MWGWVGWGRVGWCGVRQGRVGEVRLGGWGGANFLTEAIKVGEGSHRETGQVW